MCVVPLLSVFCVASLPGVATYSSYAPFIQVVAALKYGSAWLKMLVIKPPLASFSPHLPLSRPLTALIVANSSGVQLVTPYKG